MLNQQAGSGLERNAVLRRIAQEIGNRFGEVSRRGGFALEKPSHMSGLRTQSVQFYDRLGASAFKVFFTFGSTEPSA